MKLTDIVHQLAVKNDLTEHNTLQSEVLFFTRTKVIRMGGMRELRIQVLNVKVEGAPDDLAVEIFEEED